jgi:hypothetical protein
MQERMLLSPDSQEQAVTSNTDDVTCTLPLLPFCTLWQQHSSSGSVHVWQRRKSAVYENFDDWQCTQCSQVPAAADTSAHSRHTYAQPAGNI